MSEYVKSVAPNHMVALGDEGFYNKPYGYYNEYTTSNYAFYGAVLLIFISISGE